MVDVRNYILSYGLEIIIGKICNENNLEVIYFPMSCFGEISSNDTRLQYSSSNDYE
jgi:hypothetical protein